MFVCGGCVMGAVYCFMLSISIVHLSVHSLHFCPSGGILKALLIDLPCFLFFFVFFVLFFKLFSSWLLLIKAQDKNNFPRLVKDTVLLYTQECTSILQVLVKMKYVHKFCFILYVFYFVHRCPVLLVTSFLIFWRVSYWWLQTCGKVSWIP